jgi:hypothetical protein
MTAKAAVMSQMSQMIAQKTKMDFCKEHTPTGVLQATDHATDPMQTTAAAALVFHPQLKQQ